MPLTFEEALLTDAAGRPRTVEDIEAENLRRDEAKIASVTDAHRAAADQTVSMLAATAPSAAPISTALAVGDLGVDFSWAKPYPSELGGHRFVMVYLPYPGDGGKSCSRAQVQMYLAAGYHAIAIWEVAAADCLRGADVGYAHGTQARISAYETWGLPSSAWISVACDIDTTWDRVRPYFDGFDSAIGGLYLPGPYGGIKVTQPASKFGLQTHQTIAWSGGLLGDGTTVYQNGFNYYPNGTSANCDRDLVTNTPVNSWATGYIPGEGDLIVTPEDEAKIQTIVETALRRYIPRMLTTLRDGTPNGTNPPNSSTAVDNMGLDGELARLALMLRNGEANAAFPPTTPGGEVLFSKNGLDGQLGRIQARVDKVPTAEQNAAAVIDLLPPGSGGLGSPSGM